MLCSETMPKVTPLTTLIQAWWYQKRRNPYSASFLTGLSRFSRPSFSLFSDPMVQRLCYIQPRQHKSTAQHCLLLLSAVFGKCSFFQGSGTPGKDLMMHIGPPSGWEMMCPHTFAFSLANKFCSQFTTSATASAESCCPKWRPVARGPTQHCGLNHQRSLKCSHFPLI